MGFYLLEMARDYETCTCRLWATIERVRDFQHKITGEVEKAFHQQLQQWTEKMNFRQNKVSIVYEIAQ